MYTKHIYFYVKFKCSWTSYISSSDPTHEAVLNLKIWGTLKTKGSFSIFSENKHNPLSHAPCVVESSLLNEIIETMTSFYEALSAVLLF